MSSAFSIVLLVKPDPSVPHQFRSWCPDLPNWYATGSSEQEAIEAGAQIIQGLLAMRPSLVEELHSRARAVPIPVSAHPAGVEPLELGDTMPAAHEPSGRADQHLPYEHRGPESERSPNVAPEDQHQSAPATQPEAAEGIRPLRWRSIEAGSLARAQGINTWEEIDDPIGDGMLLDSEDANTSSGNAGYSIRRASIYSSPTGLGSGGNRDQD